MLDIEPVMDLPAPFIVVNFPMIDFSVENNAIRFIRGTQSHLCHHLVALD